VKTLMEAPALLKVRLCTHGGTGATVAQFGRTPT
jgi:hypothetical protein